MQSELTEYVGRLIELQKRSYVLFPAMNPWFAKAIIIVGSLAILIIPA